MNPRTKTVTKTMSGVVSVVAATLATLACLFAIFLERSGFGAPRDTDPRVGYMIALIAVIIGTWIAVWLVLRWMRMQFAWVLPLVAIAASLLVVVLMGFA